MDSTPSFEFPTATGLVYTKSHSPPTDHSHPLEFHDELKYFILFVKGDGRGLANGFFQAMFLTKIGATININSTFTCFYQPFNLVHFLCEYLQHDIVRDGN